MPTIAIAQLSSRSGKTTIAVSVAGEFARRKLDVALVDSDPQRAAGQWAELGNLNFPVYEHSLADVNAADWAEALKTIKASYIIIDTSPNLRSAGAALALADLAIVPCVPSHLDREAMEQMMSIIGWIRARRTAPLQVILVSSRGVEKTPDDSELAAAFAHFGEGVGPPIRAHSAFVRAFSTGRSVSECAPNHAADREVRALCDKVQNDLLEAARSSVTI